MKLINTTCATAHVSVTEVDGDPALREAHITAKVTLAVLPDATLRTETQDPRPVREVDVDEICGVLPSDLVGLPDSGVEVLIYGSAYAPSREPVSEVTVSVAIGELRHELLVVGDRKWVNDGQQYIGPATPFFRMPMTYREAFGGRAIVWIDPHTPVPITDPSNPIGKGFDPTPQIVSLVAQLGVPPGFPVLHYAQELPNLEDPLARISSPSETSAPACWGARPSSAAAPSLTPEDPTSRSESHCGRGHPRLVLANLPAFQPVTLQGMSPRGDILFRFPRMEMLADYDINESQGEVPLELRRILIDADASRLELLHDVRFCFYSSPGKGRSIRLRIDS